MENIGIGEWRTRDGHKAIITDISLSVIGYQLFGYTIWAADETTRSKALWTKTGKYCSTGDEHGLDIVGPWKDEEDSREAYTAYKQMFPPGTRVKATHRQTGEEIIGTVLGHNDVVFENTSKKLLRNVRASYINRNLVARWNVKWERDYRYGLGYDRHDFEPIAEKGAMSDRIQQLAKTLASRCFRMVDSLIAKIGDE